MAVSKRNTKAEDKAPRRSSRPRQEPDRFVIPLNPSQPRKSSARKKRAPKEVAGVKSARAPPKQKAKPKKQTKAPAAVKTTAQAKPKPDKKRAREDQDDDENQSRPTKRARAVPNHPKRTITTRARRVSPSPSPSPAPSSQPEPVVKAEPEDDRRSEAPTEVEPEFVGTGTLPDINAVAGLLVNQGLLPPVGQQMHQAHAPAPAPPVPPPAADPVQPPAPVPIPNPIFAPVAGPVVQPQAPLAPIIPGQPGQLQAAILGFDPQDEGQQQDWDPQVIVAVEHPLNRQNAFIQL